MLSHQHAWPMTRHSDSRPPTVAFASLPNLVSRSLAAIESPCKHRILGYILDAMVAAQHSKRLLTGAEKINNIWPRSQAFSGARNLSSLSPPLLNADVSLTYCPGPRNQELTVVSFASSPLVSVFATRLFWAVEAAFEPPVSENFKNYF